MIEHVLIMNVSQTVIVDLMQYLHLLLLLTELHLSLLLSQFIFRLRHHRRELLVRDLRPLLTQLQPTSSYSTEVVDILFTPSVDKKPTGSQHREL